MFSGTSPDNNLVEFVELPADVHPYYVATQAHPELRSRPTRPHPLFAGLIGAAIQRQRELLIPIDESALRRRWVADDDVTMDEPEAVGRRARRPATRRSTVPDPSSGLADEHLSWPVLGTRDLHRDDWVVALREDVVQRPGHPEETFGRLVVEHPGAVVVLALDDERAGLLPAPVPARRRWRVRRAARRPLRRRTARTPRSPPRASCRRRSSCRPSTGDTWSPSTRAPGITDELHHIYLATGLSQRRPGRLRAARRGGRDRAGLGAGRGAARGGARRSGPGGPAAAAVLTYDALKRTGRL